MFAHQPRASVSQTISLACTRPTARLSFYPPRLQQAWHVHGAAHLSILLTGSIRERGGRQEYEGYSGCLHLRPPEARHQVEFGPQGALVLAVEIDSHTSLAPSVGWINRAGSCIQRTLLRQLLTGIATQAQDTDDLIEDLLGSLGSEELRGQPPLWLRRAQAHLLEHPASITLKALAQDAGVHRSHFTRAFIHWFQIPPSVFRRQAMTAAALCHIMQGHGLADAADAAGFADQSHCGRAFRQLLGCTPRQLLRSS
jgi:AraC family transcriptional regulator